MNNNDIAIRLSNMSKFYKVYYNNLNKPCQYCKIKKCVYLRK